MSRKSLTVAMIVSAGGLAVGASAYQNPPVASSGATRPSPTTREVESLMRSLGDAVHSRRLAAQRQLEAYGDAAIPMVLSYVADADREIAARACAIVQSARDPGLRVRVAIRLLETASPPRIEQAVDMLFEDAEATVSLMRQATTQPSRRRGVNSACVQIVEQLELWLDYSRRSKTLYEAHRKSDPKQAQTDLVNLNDQKKELRFVAYEFATEAIIEGHAVREVDGGRRSNAEPRPATRPYP